MRFSRPFAASAAAALLLACLPASAAIVVRVGVEELTDTATLVIRGRVLESKARWTPDHATINTYVRVAVDEVLKGSAGAEVVVTCFGGTVGEHRIPVRGVPEFRKGETVVLFLWRNRRGELLPLGLNQGKFLVEKDPATGRLIARNSLKGLALVPLRPGAKLRKRPDVLPLDTLRDRVRERLRLRNSKAGGKRPGAPEKTPAGEAGAGKREEGAPGKKDAAKPGKTESAAPGGDPAPEGTETPKGAPGGKKKDPEPAPEGKKAPPPRKPAPPPEADPEKE